MGDVDYSDVESVRRGLSQGGFVEIDHAPREPGIRRGARVYNRGEQYLEAQRHGTATVDSVWRKGTDENPDSWERSYGRPNVEVIVKKDRPTGHIKFYFWQDYGTRLADEQPDPVEVAS